MLPNPAGGIINFRKYIELAAYWGKTLLSRPMVVMTVVVRNMAKLPDH